MKGFNIGVLCGGFSDEREVSLRSGENVYGILTQGGYQAFLIDLKDARTLEENLRSHRIDCVFNVLHGFYGEDGLLQSDLRSLGIPYTGCGPLSSGIGMNKLISKLIAKGLGMAVAEYRVLNPGHTPEDLKSIIRSFVFPCFLKPQFGGSSCETYFIESERELESLSLNPEKPYLVEQFIEGMEVTSGVITSGSFQIIFPILGLIPTNAFYDYEAKYTEGKTRFLCPAPLSKDLSDTIGQQSLLLHKILGCSGVTRCDFIIQKETGIPYFLEINTSPGMTKLSDIPTEAKTLGWSELELCERILESSRDPKV